ncbi:MAG: hypothetical protein Q9198_000134 [Flavoplaca austrocitrina]
MFTKLPKAIFFILPMLMSSGSTFLVEEAEHGSTSLSRRQYWGFTVHAPTHCRQGDNMVAVGPPKGSAFQHYQVTDNLDCTEGTCSVSKLEAHTFGLSLGVSIAKVLGADFGLTESWTSGETYTCQGDNIDKLCVWVKVAYTVFDTELDNPAACSNSGEKGEQVKIPREDNNGGGFYCGRKEDCQHLNANFWE